MQAKLTFKKILLITMCILHINSTTFTMMTSRLTPQYARVGNQALSVAVPQLLNNLSTGPLFNQNQTAAPNSNYNPQVKSYDNQPQVPKYSTPTNNYAKFDQGSVAKNLPQQPVIDIDKAFRDAEIDEIQDTQTADQQPADQNMNADSSMDNDFNSDMQINQPQPAFNPKLSVAQNVYGKKPASTNTSPFAQQRRDYSTFSPKSNDPYDILGVSRTATSEEIKTARNTLAKKYHPDFNKDNKEEATQALQKINNAYDKLNVSNQNNNKQEAWTYSPTPQARGSFTYKSFFDAIVNGDLPAAQDFLKNGSDIDEIGLYGWTTLEFCLKYNYVNEAVFLINNGADINRIDKDGKTPLDLATYPDLIEFLKQRGAKSSQQL